jgi:formamidopyrimidine-DNA glycosylase
MPELPEVEFARKTLEKWFRGRKLVRTEAQSGVRTFRDSDLGIFKALKGSLVGIDRRGKYLMVRFSDKLGFVGHLGMTGKFLKRDPKDEVRWSRARFFLDSGEVIHFQDMRMFGHIDAAPASELRDGLTVQQLKDALGKSTQDLKVGLMDQERIAGLGNIHAAEALFRAKLHPSRTPASLSEPEWKALTRGIQATIDFALEHEGDDDEIEYVEEGAPNPFLIYGRAGTPCRRCKTIVKSFTQGGRTTHFCPHCQPKTRRKDAAPIRKGSRSRRDRR